MLNDSSGPQGDVYEYLTTQHHMKVSIDISVSGFAEEHEMLVCSYPAIENISQGEVVLHA